MILEQKIKPLSVNECWQGKRYKTDSYKKYEAALMLMLPKKEMPKPPYKISFEFGFSSKLADYDNPIKPLQDILQKKYGFNDKDIYEATIKRVDVKKGDEYFKIELSNINEL